MKRQINDISVASGHGFSGPKEQTLDTIADAIQQHGYVVLTDALNSGLRECLEARIQALGHSDWKLAGIGREQGFHLNSNIRTDHIHWITGDVPAETSFHTWMETLRCGLNQRLFMGLFDFEAHFSKYPEGAFYQRHSDVLSGRNNRILSMVFYLNPNWGTEDAGALVLYSGTENRPIETIAPKLGTLVLFLSDKFPHEVMKANRSRFSIAGWFRGAEQR